MNSPALLSALVQQLETDYAQERRLRQLAETEAAHLKEALFYSDWLDISELTSKYKVGHTTLCEHITSGRCPMLAIDNQPAYARIKPGTNGKYQIRECYVRARYKERK